MWTNYAILWPLCLGVLILMRDMSLALHRKITLVVRQDEEQCLARNVMVLS